MSRSKRRYPHSPAQVETLEIRHLLAGFGTPWPEARDLSISIPADDVSIDLEPNSLHETLDQIANREDWVELVLRAYQTWSIHSDINVGLRADADLRFGIPGLSTQDPRFGEFRIGAFPQPGVLANSLPFQAVAGSWSGDIFLNSDANFAYHDWADGLGPDSNQQPSATFDLFSVLLHEVGNTLGIADSQTQTAVMYGNYTVPKGLLTAEDIASIQFLYGARTDPFELVDNGSLSTATLVPTPVGFDPDLEQISLRGSALGATDADVYRFEPISGRNEVTLSVHVAGVSLLTPKLEVFDSQGNLLASESANSVFENNVSITLNDLSLQSELNVRISAANNDVYSAGDYYFVIDYRDSVTRAADPMPHQYDEGIGLLGTGFSLIDSEFGLNDTVATAIALATTNGFANYHYEKASSVSAATDKDNWKIVAPAMATHRLVVNVAGVGEAAPHLKVRILDATGSSVGAIGYLSLDGTWVMEVSQPEPNAEYLVRISVDSSSAVDVGNYVAVADFVTESAQMNSFVSGTLVGENDYDLIRWKSLKTRLYRFDLRASGATSDEAVRVTIYDAVTGNVQLVLGTPAGSTRSAYVLLNEGDYLFRFSAVGRDDVSVTSIDYEMTMDGISDDQDPYGESDDDEFYDYEYEEVEGNNYPSPYYGDTYDPYEDYEPWYYNNSYYYGEESEYI